MVQVLANTARLGGAAADGGGLEQIDEADGGGALMEVLAGDPDAARCVVRERGPSTRVLVFAARALNAIG